MDLFNLSLTDFVILTIIGFTSGALSGLLGVGGGILIVPALVFFFGLSQHQAQGTSLALMLLPLGFFATKKYYQAGNVKILYAVLLIFFFIIGSFLGADFSLALDEKILKKSFGIFLLLIAIKTFFNLRKK